MTGRFRATGIRPKCAERLETMGLRLPVDMFEHVHAGGLKRMIDHVDHAVGTFGLVLGIICGAVLACWSFAPEMAQEARGSRAHWQGGCQGRQAPRRC